MINGIVIGLSTLAGVWLGWYALPICLSVLIAIKIIERDRHLVILIMCALFAALGAVRSEAPPTRTTLPELALSTGAVGSIASFPIPSGDGHRALVSLDLICVADQCIPAEGHVLAYFPTQSPALSRGHTLEMSWKVQTLQDLPLGYRGFVASHGAEGSARVSDTTLISTGPRFFQWLASANQRVATNMNSLIPGDPGALGTGIVTGDDSGLSEETEANFMATGTSHITAVSGQNVTLIIGFMSFWFRPRSVKGRIAFHLLLVSVVWSFTLFVGMESPALRAAIVATLSILGNHVGRRPDPVTLLSLTLGAIALVNPLSVYSVGFWLSAAASMALCLALPRTLRGNTRQVAAELVRAPMIASIATMPIALMSFGVWSPFSILANLLVAPIMVAAFPFAYAFALLATIAPGLAEHLAWIPTIPLEMALVVVNTVGPVAMQWRVDTFSPALLLIIWIPIAIAIWLLSNESERWIRRALANYGNSGE